MTPDPRLLLPATRALLEGWCGPGLLDNEPVLVDGDNGCVIRLDGTLVEYDTSYLPVVFDTDMRPCGTLSLPLSRAECRDRVARVLGDVRLIRIRWTTSLRFRYGYSRSAALDGPEEAVFWDLHGDAGHPEVAAFAHLDPNDDTRLPDGSRLVDALALAVVARQVLTPGGSDAR